MQLSFGENLAKLRAERNMSQAELAQSLHVSRQAVSNWERDKSYPDLDTLQQLTQVLGVSADTILSGKRSDGLSIALWPLLSVLGLFGLHLALGLAGLVDVDAVLVLPGCCAIIMLIISPTFRGMFRSGNYDMLAGFNSKKDSVPKTRLQMYWLHLLWAISSLLFELLFFAAYFVENPAEDFAVIMMGCYIFMLLAAVAAVSIKIKTR